MVIIISVQHYQAKSQGHSLCCSANTLQVVDLAPNTTPEALHLLRTVLASSIKALDIFAAELSRIGHGRPARKLLWGLVIFPGHEYAELAIKQLDGREESWIRTVIARHGPPSRVHDAAQVRTCVACDIVHERDG